MGFKSLKGSRDPIVSLKRKNHRVWKVMAVVERENKLGSVPVIFSPMGIMLRTGFKGQMMSVA